MKLYLNFAFLENLVMSDDQTDRHIDIKRLLSSPQSGMELIVDFDPEEVYRNPDQRTVFRQIAQKLPTWDANFLTNCQTKEFHETGEANLFFIDEDRAEIVQEYGCFCVSTNCLEKADFLFHVEEIPIDKSLRSWTFLKDIKHSCNSIVITDNYFFSDEKSYLENLRSICENLMPTSLADGFLFDFTIIGYDSRKHLCSVQKHYKILCDYFEKEFSYGINLTIICDTYHDRYIFTNYYSIKSGQGFALFKDQRLLPGKQTTIDFKSITHKGRLSSAAQTRLVQLQKCIAINRTERMADKFAGSRKNRLLQ